MFAGQRGPNPAAAITLALLLLTCPARGQDVDRHGALLPLAVHEGRCDFVVPTPSSDEKYYLILGTLAQGAGPYRVTVRTEASTSPVSLPLENRPPDAGWAQRISELNARLVKARDSASPAEEYQPSAEPPLRKPFYLFTHDHDFEDRRGYASINGELRSVGLHCQVYVDRDYPDMKGLQPTVDDVVHTFDNDIYPQARRRLGQALDVDRDGRFTILFTGWLGKLCNGKATLDGFVRGSDFYRDLEVPYGNRCDMMYLNTALKPGAYLRSLLAHEYTHAIIFSEHVFGTYLPEVSRQDEQGWLNEALAHLNEDRHGYSWNNLDYRISAFLSAPERYQLVVPDYYGAGLWRCHGCRGATFLFLRWCADRSDPDFPKRLIRTNLTGLTNLEVTLQEPFADLFRRWSAAVVLNGTNLATGDMIPPSHVNLRRPLEGRLLCGPHFQEVPLAGGDHEIKMAGTSMAAILLHAPAGARSRVIVQGDADAGLQVSLIRLPQQTARLSLHHEFLGNTTRSVRLVLTVHDADAVVDGTAWERLVPATNRPEDTSYRAESAADDLTQTWLGHLSLKAGETQTSAAMALPKDTGSDQALVFKVSATDKAGHHLAAWDVVETPPSTPSLGLVFPLAEKKAVAVLGWEGEVDSRP